MSRRVPVCVYTVVTLVALIGTPWFRPGAVFAASGTVSMETPLHDSPDPAAPVIALLPEGTVVSLDGPPLDGFYPVTANDLSGWLLGETLQVEKDAPATDTAEEMTVEPPVDGTVEMDPGETSTEFDPALATSVEPATEPTVDTPAATEESPPAVDPALEEETVSTAESVPADGMTPLNEPVPVDAAAAAPETTSTGDVTAVPTSPGEAVPPPDSAAGVSEGAEESVTDPNLTPIPVPEVAPVGPASIMVDAPILAGPGPDYGFIAMAPAGGTVEKTGHVINGYATVQYAEVTGWLALEHLGAPGTLVAEPPSGETPPVEAAAPVEPLAAEASPAETAPSETTPMESLATETPPELPTTETTPAEPAPVETAPVETTPTESVPVDTAPIEAAPVEAPPGEVASADAT